MFGIPHLVDSKKAVLLNYNASLSGVEQGNSFPTMQ